MSNSRRIGFKFHNSAGAVGPLMANTPTSKTKADLNGKYCLASRRNSTNLVLQPHPKSSAGWGNIIGNSKRPATVSATVRCCLSKRSLHVIENMARPEGLEPPTLCLEGRRSFQLSYGRYLFNFSYCIRFRYFLLTFNLSFDHHSSWAKRQRGGGLR
jgi:hypothetical protein